MEYSKFCNDQRETAVQFKNDKYNAKKMLKR
jgi:hypothetical protein